MGEPAYNFFKQQLCRICLSILANSEKLRIFSEECFYQKDTLLTVLKELTPILIDASDSLPKNICLKCSETVKEMIKFKRSIEHSNRMLHYTLKTAHTKYIIQKSEVGNAANFDNILESVLKSMVVIDSNLNASNTTKCYIPLEEVTSHTQEIRKTLFSGKQFVEELLNNKYQTSTSVNKKIPIVPSRVEPQADVNEISDEIERPRLISIVKKNNFVHRKSTPSVTEKQKTLPCDKCDKTFSEYSFLRQHLLYHSLNIELPECKPAPQKSPLSSSLPEVVKQPLKPLTTPNTLTTQALPLSKVVEPQKPLTQSSSLLEVVEQSLKPVVTPKTTEALSPATQTVKPCPKPTVRYCYVQCKYCEEKVFEINIRQHNRSRHMEELKKLKKQKLTCPICKTMVAKKSTLKQHMIRHEKRFKCDRCELLFETPFLLREHQFEAHGIFRQHLCHICGKLCSVNFLKSHLNTHNADKSFKCPIENCTAKLKYAKSLRDHMDRVHGTQRDFICEICGKSYVVKSDLTAHLRIHDNIIKHQCNLCGQSFRYLFKLKRHIMFHHQRLKPHKCPECPQMFAVKHTIRKHCAIYHPYHPLALDPSKIPKQTFNKHKLFKCMVCRTKLATEFNLRKHFERNHPNHVLNFKDLRSSNETDEAVSNLQKSN